MNGVLFALGLALLPLGCASLYLASPNQRWLARLWPAAAARAAGLLSLAAGLAVLWQIMQGVAAAFTFATGLMLLFVVFPYLGALRGGREKS